jgi:hypothetical protein
MTQNAASQQKSDLIQLLGSPFVEGNQQTPSEEYLLSIYDRAFKDRVALLLLEKYKRSNWKSELRERHQKLCDRQAETFAVITRLAKVLNDFDPECYVIFKSIKPYPATPNDTDVLFLKGKKEYKKAYQYLLDAGYVFHEWAPQQKTVYDPRGIGKIGKGKKGGTYYIDFYEQISSDYFAYLDRRKLFAFIVTREINGVPAKLLRPEPELAIILFHNVFPERTFQLEHFYVPLYYMAANDFDEELFTHFVKTNGISRAVRCNLSLVSYLHEKYFHFVPAVLTAILGHLKVDEAELKRFRFSNEATPYLFSQRVFWMSFLEKAREPYCLRSLVVQFLRMLNPVFFFDVVRTLKLRLGSRGAYHLE